MLVLHLWKKLKHWTIIKSILRIFLKAINNKVSSRLKICVISTLEELPNSGRSAIAAPRCDEKDKLNDCISNYINEKEKNDIKQAMKAKIIRKGRSTRIEYVVDEKTWKNIIMNIINKDEQSIINCVNKYKCGLYFGEIF